MYGTPLLSSASPLWKQQNFTKDYCQILGFLVPESEMEPKRQPGAAGCVAAVTTLGSAEALTEKPSLCECVPSPGDPLVGRGVFWPVLPAFILHEKVFPKEELASCMTLVF